MPKQTPPHHHLIVAFRNWMLENFDTVHLHVNALRIQDPFIAEFARNDVVSLNVTAHAIGDFYVGQDMVAFKARFSGQSREIILEPTAVLGLLGFNKDTDDEPHYVPLPEGWDAAPSIEKKEVPEKKRPSLSVVK